MFLMSQGLCEFQNTNIQMGLGEEVGALAFPLPDPCPTGLVPKFKCCGFTSSSHLMERETEAQGEVACSRSCSGRAGPYALALGSGPCSWLPQTT